MKSFFDWSPQAMNIRGVWDEHIYAWSNPSLALANCLSETLIKFKLL